MVLSLDHWMDEKFTTLTSLNSSPNSIKINWKLKLAQKFLLSRIPVTLDQGQSQLDQYNNVAFNSIYHHAKFKHTDFLRPNAGLHYSFLTRSVKQQVFLLFH